VVLSVSENSLNNKSYVHGVSLVPLLGMTIGECLEHAVQSNPDGLALSVPYQDVRWTYRELNDRVVIAAAALARLGLTPGDRLGILAPNCSEWVLIQFAAARIGLILVNLNPAYRLGELEYALDKSGCSALVTVKSFKTSQYIEMLRELAPTLDTADKSALVFDTLPELRQIILLGNETAAGCWSFNELMSNSDEKSLKRAERYAKGLQFDDVINIQFTSGTTGSPKATALTHHNILNNAWFVGQKMQLTPADRICLPVPMYHCFGMVLGSLCALAHQAATVLSSPGFNAGEVLKTIETEKCTALYGVPTMFISELEHPTFSQFDLGSLRTGIMAGAPCPKPLMDKVITDMHINELTIAYGMTETGPVSFQTSVQDSIGLRTTTVGQVLPHIEIKIVDEQRRIVPLGTEGELLTRGYSVMPYYWGDEVKTSKAIDSARWIASGDRATLDKDGYCRIVGRIKDMLIRGGENIFPKEIEEYLYQHPAIEQVEVIGVADPKYGEEVCAWIKRRAGKTLTAEEIVEFCTDRIAHFKIPKYIKFVEEFPMTVTGKVQKFKIREIMDADIARHPDQYRVNPIKSKSQNSKNSARENKPLKYEKEKGEV